MEKHKYEEFTKTSKHLDKHEQELEDNFDKLIPVDNVEKLKKKLMNAAKAHLLKKKPITIRVSALDIEAIKIKASKHGIPYQTYLNMLIHKDATSI